MKRVVTNYVFSPNSLIVLAAFVLLSCETFAQGLINNGARIVVTTGSNIYIDGSGTGHYTSQVGGVITNATAGGTITALGNWVNNSANVGFSNDGATVVLGGANQSIGGTNSTTFYNLTLQGTGTKTLNINTTAGGQTLNNGVLALTTRPLDLNTYRLDITNSATGAITYTSGYIQSETNVAVNPSIVRWYVRTTTGAHVYPFGVAGTQIPFTFNVTTAMGAATDYVDVSTRATATSNNTPWAGPSNVAAVAHMYDPNLGQDGSDEAVVDRWWDITPSSPVTATVTFSYRGIENTLWAPYNIGFLGAQHWNGGGWDAPIGADPAVMAGVGTVTAPGLSSFSPFVLSEVTVPLPIELTEFTGHCVSNGIFLSWTTASENNSDYFEVQRSENGTNYMPVGTVSASQYASSYTNYSFIDQSAAAKPYYYRLKMVDNDGAYDYCSSVEVQSCAQQNGWFEIAQNSNNQVMVDIDFPYEEKFRVMMYDKIGNLVYTEVLMPQTGFSRNYISAPIVAAGIYTVQVTTSQFSKAKKVFLTE